MSRTMREYATRHSLILFQYPIDTCSFKTLDVDAFSRHRHTDQEYDAADARISAKAYWWPYSEAWP